MRKHGRGWGEQWLKQETVVTCRLLDNDDVTCMISISVLPRGGCAHLFLRLPFSTVLVLVSLAPQLLANAVSWERLRVALPAVSPPLMLVCPPPLAEEASETPTSNLFADFGSSFGDVAVSCMPASFDDIAEATLMAAIGGTEQAVSVTCSAAGFTDCTFTATLTPPPVGALSTLAALLRRV